MGKGVGFQRGFQNPRPLLIGDLYTALLPSQALCHLRYQMNEQSSKYAVAFQTMTRVILNTHCGAGASIASVEAAVRHPTQQ